MRAKSHGGYPHPVLLLYNFQGAERVFDICPSRGEFGARDQVIDVWKYAIEALIDRVDVNADGDRMSISDTSGTTDRRRVVSIDMEHARASDLFVRDFVRRKGKAIRTIPEHSSLPRRLVDQNIRGLVGTTCAGLDMFQVYTGGLQALHLNAAALIVTDRTDVFGAKPQPCTRNNRARDLATRTENLFVERNLPSIRGEVRNNDESVSRVQPDTNYVK